MSLYPNFQNKDFEIRKHLDFLSKRELSCFYSCDNPGRGRSPSSNFHRISSQDGSLGGQLVHIGHILQNKTIYFREMSVARQLRRISGISRNSVNAYADDGAFGKQPTTNVSGKPYKMEN